MTPDGALLLGADTVTLYAPVAVADEHGWALAGDVPAWEGTGNLQLTAGTSDPRQADGGGHGPHDPAAVPAGVLYLPAGAGPVADGWTAQARGRRWVLDGVRVVADPIEGPGGPLSCIAADVREATYATG